MQNTLSVIQDCSILDQNRSMKMKADLNFSQKKASKENYSTCRARSKRSVDSTSGYISQRSRKKSDTRSQINLLRSITPGRMSDRTFRSEYSQSAMGVASTHRFAGERSGSRDQMSPTRDKFDFPCFIAFLIKLGPKVYPKLSENPKSAVLLLVEQFVLSLLGRQNDGRSIQNTQVSRLVNLVNSKIMVDFMGELFYALSDIYPRYTDGGSDMMTFE